MPKTIKISDDVIKQLDSLRHIGQSYDGLLRELLEKLDRLEGVVASDKHKD